MSMQDNPFIRETIEAKKDTYPKRLLKAAGIAATFGLVAGLVFGLLQPIFGNNKTAPQEKIVILKDEESQPEEISGNEGETESVENDRREDLEDLAEEDQLMSSIVGDIKKGLVWVSPMTEAEPDNEEEAESFPGCILAISSGEYCILTHYLKEKTLSVRFYNGIEVQGSLQATDSWMDLAIVKVPFSEELAARIPNAAAVTVGSSASVLQGSQIIAVGRVTGQESSSAWGHVSGIGGNVAMPDMNCNVIHTDIYEEPDAEGLLFNTKCQLVGIINRDAGTEGSRFLSGVGVSSLKTMIEELSNDESRSFLGVVCENIPSEMELPRGIYVNSCTSGSPAYAAGILSGDIITKVNEYPVLTVSDLQAQLEQHSVGDQVILSLRRSGRDGYIEYEYEVVLGERN